MNESRQSRNNLNQPVGFSTSDLGKNMGMPLMVNSKGTDIYDQSPVNATGKQEWKSSTKLNSTQPFFIDKHNYQSLEQNFDSSMKLQPEYQKTLTKYNNNQGFLSDLEEFMNMNYNTTASDGKGLNPRYSSMSATSFHT